MSRIIERLTAAHHCIDFTCGNDWLDRYIRKHALRNQELRYGQTYIARADKISDPIDGYYTISMGCVSFEHLPAALNERVPRYPMPVAHIGCLAVRKELQGQGLGGILLIDALRRIVAAADVIAARAVEVRAIDPPAREWYVRFGFLPFNDAPLHLFLPMTTAQQLVASIAE